MRPGVTREGGERMRPLAGDDDSQDRPWFFRRTSSAPELDGRVRAGANLSKREWRPAAQRDILAQHFYDSNFKFDLACKPEVASSISLRNKSGGAQRHEAAKSSSVSLPPSPLLPPERAYWQCSSGSSSSCSSYPSSSCSSYPSPACHFSVYEGGNWMREGAQSPLSDISDMEDDNPLERTRSGNEEGEQAERNATEHGEVHAGRSQRRPDCVGRKVALLLRALLLHSAHVIDHTRHDTRHDIRASTYAVAACCTTHTTHVMHDTRASTDALSCMLYQSLPLASCPREARLGSAVTNEAMTARMRVIGLSSSANCQTRRRMAILRRSQAIRA
jgi:hypothetical protein